MNSGFCEDLDTNFELACDLAEKDFTHNELLKLLSDGNIPEKQIAAWTFDYVENDMDAQVLVANLTGCDGKIREAVALKINTLLHSDKNLIKYFIYPEVFANASIDINGNICRLVADSVQILKQNDDFSKRYLGRIIEFTNESFKELDNFIFRDKKYVINKQLFKLYWCLENIRTFIDIIPTNDLTNILSRALNEKEYTIREKVAQILVCFDKNKFIEFRNILKNDENYYVKTIINK